MNPQISRLSVLSARRACFQAGRNGRLPPSQQRHASRLGQALNADNVHFPGAVNSKFTTTLKFETTPDAIPTFRIMNQDGAILNDAHKPDLSHEQMIEMYKNMILVSILDEIMLNAQRQGRLSFYMPSAGEEGIAVGSASALTNDDVCFLQYREAGVLRQRGFTLKDFMAQLFANVHDPGQGRNMPVHYGSKALNVHSISSPLATQIPQAAGAAYALKMQRINNPSLPPRVVACYFGEGAASEGDFHAALNMAATRSCPVVFICRNNGYAISTPTLEQYRGDGIASRGTGYGIDTIRVDGNDIFAVREVTKRAREMALNATGTGHGAASGCRPVLIEAMSYRVSHHSTSDDSFAYRARVEVEDWKRRDNPLTRLRKYLEREGAWDEEREKATRAQIRKDLLKAFAQGEREKKPPIKSMFTDVYEELTPDLKAQMAELKGLIERWPEEYDVSEFEGGIDSLK